MTDTSLSADRSGWFSLVSSTLTAVIVGFASTILVIMEAARNVGATPSQQASWAAALCFAMAVSSFILSWRYRMPMITAWSTPGAVLIATSGSGISYPNALGAFVVAGVLMVVAGLIKPLEKAIEKIPAPIAAEKLTDSTDLTPKSPDCKGAMCAHDVGWKAQAAKRRAADDAAAVVG